MNGLILRFAYLIHEQILKYLIWKFLILPRQHIFLYITSQRN